MSITERMKKYEELLIVESMTSKTEKDMFSDLQTTVKALKVAREALVAAKEEVFSQTVPIVDNAIETINDILGAKP